MATAEVERRMAALKELTVRHGLIDDARIGQFEHDALETWTSDNGARLVARAWTDDAFRQRLLDDGVAAAAEFGFRLPVHHRRLAVVENTADVHNVICCTLCSCTAFTIVGLAPGWYKDLEYRARIVRESRTVLAELGLALAPSMRIRVWDTTADTRYMVLPFRPSGTDGWTEAQLAALVTQDALIGVARLETPYR